MLKVAVFSDTHGNPDNMRKAIRECDPVAVIHCGDGVRDAASMEREFPGLPVYSVLGNCDFTRDVPLARTVEIGGVRIYIVHGHSLGVKYEGLDRVGYAAREAGASVAFFGHTHTPVCRILGNITIINPGSAGYGFDTTWGILEIDNGNISWYLKHFMDKE